MVFHSEQHSLIPLGYRGKETTLNVPASRCLLLMLQHPGINIGKPRFYSEVWENNGQYVTANTFHQNISLLRKGLRNAGIRTSVIQTIPKFGVRFTGTVQALEEGEDEVIPSRTSINKLPTPSTVHYEHPQEETYVGAFLKKVKNVNFLMFVITCSLLLFTLRSQNSHFFDSHIKIADVNQCSVYVSKNDSPTRYNQYINYLAARNVVCAPQEFIYVVNQLLSDDALYQYCESGKAGRLNCSVHFNLSTVRTKLENPS